jgi:hypothetical protein
MTTGDFYLSYEHFQQIRRTTMEPGELHWRETYFVFFPANRRPKSEAIKKALGRLSNRFVLQNLEQDDEGAFESIVIEAPDDHAALEISFEAGESVVEQGAQLAKQLKDDLNREQLAELTRADARLDIMHFEHVHGEDGFDEGEDDDDEDEILDPGCLLLVVAALAELTGGLPIDPASGAVVL